MYWAQFGGGPSEDDLRKMDPSFRLGAGKKNRK